MSFSEKNVETLIDFGLTHNQAKVYVAVARLKLASISQISKASKVRREDVYRILPKLERMGLAERLLGKPTKVRAAPVEDALSILIKQEEDAARERVSALKAKKEIVLERFARAPKLEVKEEANFVLLPNRETITSKTRLMIRKAEKNIDLICSRTKLMQFAHEFAEQMTQAAKKQVQIRIVSDMPERGDTTLGAITRQTLPAISFDLRFSDLQPAHFLIVDYKEALVATTTGGNLAENPKLWTSSTSLVGVFQRSFEDLWHNATRWEAIETNAVPEKVLHFVEQLRPTNHVIFVYDDPVGKYNVLFNYLKAGLDKGEAGVYVASDEDPNRVRDAMREFGIDVEGYERTDALHILGYEEIYIRDKKFNMASTINKWTDIYKSSLEKGFTGLRVTGETACFFKHNMVHELLEYEKALHTVLDIPMIAVCAYSASLLNGTYDPVNLYTELARAHGTILFTGLDAQLGRMEVRKM
ncbi:hypothetical protein GWN49_07325 [Candidatus Bathyarchaeota archaeon]|nr:hypothetical protein [Candidatus Bathyarchaeota archaeon]